VTTSAPTPVPGSSARPAPGKGGTGHFSLAGEFRSKPGLVLGVGGAAAVVIYALAKRSSGASSGAVSDTGAVSNETPAPVSYDSSGTDIYNSLESQLGVLQSQLAGMATAPTGGNTTTSTAPAAPSVASGYYRDIKTGNIYEEENGKRYGVSTSTLSKLLKTKKPPVIKQVDAGWNGYQQQLQTARV